MPIRMMLPPEGTFYVTGPSDPIEYYYRSLIGRLYRKRIDTALSLLPDRRFGSVIELGYGSGVLIPTLKGISDSYYGVDIESEPSRVYKAIEKIQLKENIKLYKGNILSLSLPKVDLIVAISVFEHIKDPAPILEAFMNLLKEDGYLLIGMPKVASHMNLLFRMIGFSDINPLHVTTLKKVLRMAKGGFQVVGKANMPLFLPALFSVYHAVLLEKK